MITVKLNDIAAALDEVSEEVGVFLNTETGEIVAIEYNYLRIVEESDENGDFSEYADWERECIAQAIDILKNWNIYKGLPTHFEIDEYRIMEDFCYSFPDKAIAERLCDAINGRGAFRRFKNLIYRLGIQEQWYEYREEAFLKLAREWCEFNEIPYNPLVT